MTVSTVCMYRTTAIPALLCRQKKLVSTVCKYRTAAIPAPLCRQKSMFRASETRRCRYHQRYQRWHIMLCFRRWCVVHITISQYPEQLQQKTLSAEETLISVTCCPFSIITTTNWHRGTTFIRASCLTPVRLTKRWICGWGIPLIYLLTEIFRKASRHTHFQNNIFRQNHI